MKTLKRWLLAILLMIFPISVLACSNTENVSNISNSKVHMSDYVRYPFSMQDKDKFLIRYPEQTKEEVDIEDKALMKKYSQYNSSVALMKANKFSYQKLEDTDRVLILLEGGPRFFKSWDHLDETINKKFPGFKIDVDNNGYLKSSISSIYVKPIFGFSNREDRYLTYDVETALYLMEKKFNTKIKEPYSYSFINSQMVLASEVFNKIYSYQEMTEIQLMNSIILHQTIANFKKQGKKVFVYGSSYGAKTLYNYITRYGNDADGMFAAGGSIKTRYGIYQYFKGKNYHPYSSSQIPSIDFLKENFNRENFPRKNLTLSELSTLIKEEGEDSAREYVLSNNLWENYKVLMNVTENLTNSSTFSRKPLNDKTIIAYGTEDDHFRVIDWNEVGYPSYYFLLGLNGWIWSNILKSGAHLMKMKGVWHAAKFPSESASPYILANMLLEKPVLNINNDAKMQQIWNWLHE